MIKAMTSCIALAAIALACLAPSAAAHEFLASPENSGFVGKGGTQTITLGGNAVSCESATIDGSTTSGALLTEVNYETCEAFSKPATVSGAAYVLSADGSGGIAEGNKATIVAKPSLGAECVYTLPETAEAVANVGYSNSESGITISAALKGLSYELKEKGTTVCGEDGEKSSEGGYEGEVATESYEEGRCVFDLGGFYWPFCFKDEGKFFEIKSGYTTLKWL